MFSFALFSEAHSTMAPKDKKAAAPKKGKKDVKKEQVEKTQPSKGDTSAFLTATKYKATHGKGDDKTQAQKLLQAGFHRIGQHD